MDLNASELEEQGFIRVLQLKELGEGNVLTRKIGSRTVTFWHPCSRLPKPRPVPAYARKLASRLGEVEHQRDVKEWKKNGPVIYAMDEFCYHEGGPLSAGDIEDWDGKACVKCPYHSYSISLEKGERFVQDLSGNFKSLGIKQRTHQVRIAGDQVFVKLTDDSSASPESCSLPSDRFQGRGPLSRQAYQIDRQMRGASPFAE